MPSVPKISRLFIANRGEICRRIALTAQRRGIPCVAITDRDSPPAFLCDLISTFVRVPEESPALYLDMQKMVDLALESRCDAIHPGFGFLSENSAFAALCQKSGLIWIGPNAESIETMASKSTARDVALRAGVPCIEGLPGFDLTGTSSSGADAGMNLLTAFAKKTGYPLLVKAAYGGGGKGMRLIYKESELRENALRASSEAKNSFGNPMIIVERYLESPRHIEVQILADKHGQVVAIGDRDCSLQRRHQKIIEEAPAPGLLPEVRSRIHEAAINLARSVGYDNAGTVEFLLDDKTDSQGQVTQKFYFLEMNTRLQVEHPVSEEVFGVDLVEWQLRVACNEPLPDHFKSLHPRGHSIEARLYAEHVENDYFPAPGPVRAFMPASGPGVRWEIGIDTVDEVSTRFDPMVAKLVVTGADRISAMDRMFAALQNTFFAAAHTNRELLMWLVGHSEFRNKSLNTHFLKDQLPVFKAFNEKASGLLKNEADLLLDSLASGAAMVMAGTPGNSLGASGFGASFSANAATSSAFGGGLPASMAKNTGPGQINITASGHWSNAAIPGATSTIGRGIIADSAPDSAFPSHGGAAPHAKVTPFWYAACNYAGRKEIWVAIHGCHFGRVMERKQRASGDGALVTHELSAPVPGKVVTIKAAANQDVALGDAVVVLESMKMEFEVKASRAGTIAEVKVKVGDQVTAGQTLAIWAD